MKHLMSLLLLLSGFGLNAQQQDKGWFSLGVRSSLSAFSEDGKGLGTGGQFRIQFANRINSDWFADYISINTGKRVRSDYYHIGWSVLFYPFAEKTFHSKWSPYFLAGHCFDYNRKVEISNTTNAMSRWGSAVQTGLGVHFHLSDRFDVSLTSQYMIHLTNEINYTDDQVTIVFSQAKQGNVLEGHLLSTLSLNYKIAKLWGRD